MRVSFERNITSKPQPEMRREQRISHRKQQNPEGRVRTDVIPALQGTGIICSHGGEIVPSYLGG